MGLFLQRFRGSGSISIENRHAKTRLPKARYVCPNSLRAGIFDSIFQMALSGTMRSSLLFALRSPVRLEKRVGPVRSLEHRVSLCLTA